MTFRNNVISAGLLLSAFVSGNAGAQVWSETTPGLKQLQKMPSGVLEKTELDELIEIGEKLFGAKFTTTDGAGRPNATQAIIPTKARHRTNTNFARLPGPDAQACSSCHNDPVIGGAGDFVTNVFVSEGFSNANFDTTDPQFSNERGTNHLFGAGLIELLAREMSADLIAIRNDALNQAAINNEPVKAKLETKGVQFGFITALPDGLIDLTKIEGIDTDLVIRPFSQKGVMTSLRQFTVNALNHHHGMQPDERFGARWTGSDDFDEDDRNSEITNADVSALVAWQATLRTPTELVPSQENWKTAAAKGERAFADFKCNACHIKSLPLKSLKFQDPGPFDVSGTLNNKQVKTPATYDMALLEWAKSLPKNSKGETLVPLFGDLKRHKMTDRSISTLGNELLSQRFVGRDIFMTAELWGVGTTAPYGHRNDFTTLESIILAHSGSARKSRDAYAKADSETRSSIIAYLKTLVIEK
jgi:cytochrome c peroxidase